MTYLPTELINEDYYYNYNNNSIIIYKNCNSNNCDCVEVFPDFDYQISKTYSCELTSNNLDYTNFTDDIYYRKDFPLIFITFTLFALFIFYIPLIIYSKLFRRRL